MQSENDYNASSDVDSCSDDYSKDMETSDEMDGENTAQNNSDHQPYMQRCFGYDGLDEGPPSNPPPF